MYTIINTFPCLFCRGHTVRAVSESFQLGKDSGYKVIAHMMPDLPNVGLERDIEQFIEFFENPAFRADGLKIYPTLVIRGTGLYELWKTGRYKSYPPGILVDLIARILALVPPWTRIYRVQRDIPMPLVTSGVEHGNLRELALARLKDFGSEVNFVVIYLFWFFTEFIKKHGSTLVQSYIGFAIFVK